MPITDKELLVICNLSNLKMEFANLKKEESKKETTDKNEDLSAEKILSNHTIYSLLNSEYNAINNNKIEERVFYKEKEGKEENEKKIKIPIYSDFKILRKTAPIVMEYFDRYRESGKRAEHEGEFLENWEIIYSADLYQIIIDNSYQLYSIFYDNTKKNKYI